MSWTYRIGFVTFDERRKPAKRLSVLRRVRFGQKADVLDPKEQSNARQGRILRAGIDIPDGDTTPERRRDVAVIFKDLPEPIDLELDLAKRTIYWTDRGIHRLETRSSGTDGCSSERCTTVLLGGLQVIETIRKMSSTHEYCDFAV
jgi:hypothetical protein